MGQKKLIRFAAIKEFPNVLEFPKEIKGQWNVFLKNENPVTLELACGKGEYTVGLSRLYPQRNFIGIDIKGNRIYIGAKKCLDEGLTNGAFLRTQIDRIAEYFASGEVEEIWLTFPDPQLRTGKFKKRLTHPKFLRLYQQFLKPGGTIHLKTDSPQLYHFTKTVIELFELILVKDLENVYSDNDIDEVLKIKTHYEGLDIAQSSQIFYLQFRLPEIIPQNEEQLKQRVFDEEKTG
ncbi:MAG: tRNA (guanosine(46)-N7)-methyltransferase TrmB [Sphingobacteriales bacterium]|nr:tRNA (guanosine(46)-N7)-methyltransferase TrmB [Sphingobacteriales bacterium]